MTEDLIPQEQDFQDPTPGPDNRGLLRGYLLGMNHTLAEVDAAERYITRLFRTPAPKSVVVLFDQDEFLGVFTDRAAATKAIPALVRSTGPARITTEAVQS